MSLWSLVAYVFYFEIFVVVLLMAISYLPKVIRRPIKECMKKLNSPMLGQFTVFFIVVLAACFVESLRTASKHKHHDEHGHGDGLKDKLFHDTKRLRAERNSYIAFGSLFLVLVISQLWTLLKRIIDLEEAAEKELNKHEALKKQVQNREAQSGLVEVAKGLAEVEKTGRLGSETAADYEKKISALQAEVDKLKAARGTDTEIKDKEAAAAAADLKKRSTGTKTSKDD